MEKKNKRGPYKPEDEKLTEKVDVRVTKSQKERLREKSNEKGQSIKDFLREKIEGFL